MFNSVNSMLVMEHVCFECHSFIFLLMESRCAADCIHSSSAESNPNRSTQYDRSMDVTKLLEQIRSVVPSGIL